MAAALVGDLRVILFLLLEEDVVASVLDGLVVGVVGGVEVAVVGAIDDVRRAGLRRFQVGDPVRLRKAGRETDVAGERRALAGRLEGGLALLAFLLRLALAAGCE